MNIGLIIIIVIALALILGPVMMLRPNAAQKYKEGLRRLARAEGVHYSIRNIPRQADEQEQPAGVPVYFFPPLKTQTSPGWMLVRTHYEHDLHFLGWWNWQGEERPTDAELEVLREHLPTLPESVRAVSSAGQGVTVYWEEQGGEPVLQQVLSLLKSLRVAVTLE